MGNEWDTETFPLLIVGDPNSGEVIIEPGLTAALQDYYAPLGTISSVSIRLIPSDGSYFYIVAGFNSVSGNDFAAMGNAKPGATVAADISQQWFSFFNSNTNISQIEFGDAAHDRRVLVHSNFTQFGGSGLRGDIDMYGILQSLGGHDIHIFGGGANLNKTVLIQHTADFQMGDGVNPPDTFFGREAAGVFYFQNTNVDFLNSGLLSAPFNAVEYGLVNAGAAVATSVAGAEAAIPAASWAHEPSLTFKNGRLYRLTLVWAYGLSTAALTGFTVKLRKGSASTVGQILGQTSAMDTQNAIFRGGQPLICYVQNISGADITTKISATIKRAAGTADPSLYGDSAGNPFTLTIEDIGKAGPSSFGNLAVSIV